MDKYDGNVISEGIAIGKIRYFDEEKLNTNKSIVKDVYAEIERFNAARMKAKEQLKNIYKEAVMSVGKDMAEIFEVQQLILLDEEYVNKIRNKIIKENVNSEYAIYCVSKEFSRQLIDSQNIYLSDRVADINDVSDRIIRILNKQGVLSDACAGEIIVINEISPSEMLRINEASGIISVNSSATSHAAIMARNMGLVHITNINISEDLSDKIAIIDGYKGIIYIEPDEDTLSYYLNMKNNSSDDVKECVHTSDGKCIKVCANISSVAEAYKAIEKHCDGIGLFRSEFEYMNRTELPTEDAQFELYRELGIIFGDKEVIIRTLDLGADKRIEYLEQEKENNPALGLRGIRYSLLHKEIFKTQLKAIYRASIYGNLSVMFPMITSLEEIREIKEVISKIKKELSKENIEYRDVSFGIMIETPAAAMISDILVKEVDFISLGTNDLTQYALAVDRENVNISKYYNPYHKGIIKMMEYAITNAKKSGCRVGICGELASDETIIKSLIDLGVEEFSVSQSKVQKIKKYISSI